MADRSYPIDAIGNAVTKGALVQVTLPTPTMIFRVVNVDPAGTIVPPGGGQMALEGQLLLQAVIPVPFAAGQPMQNILVLKEPESDGPKLSMQ